MGSGSSTSVRCTARRNPATTRTFRRSSRFTSSWEAWLGVSVSDTTITDDDVALWLSEWTRAGVCERLAKHKVMTPRELAFACRIKPQVIYNYLKTGRIDHELNSSGKKVIPKDEVYKYLRARLQK